MCRTPRCRRSSALRFRPAGDLAVSVELGQEISVDVNTRVRALEFLIQQKGLTGVVETVPTFSSLLVYYDPRAVGYEALCASIAELVPQATTGVLPPARTVELPCCYDAELGFDLEAAAGRLALAVDELVRLHASAEYLVYFIGFTPGLPYMTGMPERINIIDAGPQTTVQDLGRAGQLRYGIPPSGPVDRFAFVLANRLVGNPDSAAALECTLVGPRFEVDQPAAIAVTGADMPVTVNGR